MTEIELEFTGERYVPSLNGQIKYEHLHRYACALPLVAGKTVLDIAAGEGYGAALLARRARQVFGVDLEAAVVAHAARKYAALANLEFRAGACDAIPLPDHSLDVVTSFETIEHHDRHEAMLREIKRVLRPDGLFIISSPNKEVYTDLPDYHNPYHVKELYYGEFVALLQRHFKHLAFFGQRLATASFIYALENAGAPSLQAYTGAENNLQQQGVKLPEPVYFLALCSEQEVATRRALDSIYVEGKDDLLKVQTQMAAALRAQLQQQQAQLEEALTRAEQLGCHNRELALGMGNQADLFTALEQQRSEQAALASEFAQRTREQTALIAALESQVQQKEAIILAIINSRAWRLMQMLWRARNFLLPRRGGAPSTAASQVSHESSAAIAEPLVEDKR